jgi:hypothetical protein
MEHCLAASLSLFRDAQLWRWRWGTSTRPHEVIRVRCEAQRVAHRAIGEQLRANVNSTERSGRETKAKRRSLSNPRTGRNVKGRERSNPDSERSGRVGRGAIRVQRRAGSGGQGAIPAQCRRPSVEHEAIRERGKALKVLIAEQSAASAGIRCQPRSTPCIAQDASVEQGVIPGRCEVPKIGTSNSGRYRTTRAL